MQLSVLKWQGQVSNSKMAVGKQAEQWIILAGDLNRLRAERSLILAPLDLAFIGDLWPSGTFCSRTFS